jgi:hypothetical protein
VSIPDIMASERVSATPGDEEFLQPHILSKTNQLLQNFTAKRKFQNTDENNWRCHHF